MSRRHNDAVGGMRPWEPPTVKPVGTVGDVLRGGGGKDSVMPADPGETRKPKLPSPEN